MLQAGFAVFLLVLCGHSCFSELTLNGTEDPGVWATDSPLQKNLSDSPGAAQTVPTTAATTPEFKKGKLIYSTMDFGISKPKYSDVF